MYSELIALIQAAKNSDSRFDDYNYQYDSGIQLMQKITMKSRMLAIDLDQTNITSTEIKANGDRVWTFNCALIFNYYYQVEAGQQSIDELLALFEPDEKVIYNYIVDQFNSGIGINSQSVNNFINAPISNKITGGSGYFQAFQVTYSITIPEGYCP